MKRTRKADECDGVVSVLCFACRRTTDTTKQQGLTSFLIPDSVVATPTSIDVEGKVSSKHDTRGAMQCSKCRRVMEQKLHLRIADKSNSGTATASKSRVLPQISRLRQYQRLSAEQGMPFAISEHAAAAMMRNPCVICGVPAPTEGHGLTRLRIWPEGLAKPPKGGFMGPFHADNLATACSTCNLMKGARRIRGFIEAARHISTHRSDADFGSYPHRFRNNTSKRSRSCYVTASSTHSKSEMWSTQTASRTPISCSVSSPLMSTRLSLPTSASMYLISCHALRSSCAFKPSIQRHRCEAVPLLRQAVRSPTTPQWSRPH